MALDPQSKPLFFTSVLHLLIECGIDPRVQGTEQTLEKMIELTKENKLELYRRLINSFRIRSILFMSVIVIISLLCLWGIFMGIEYPETICEIVEKRKYSWFLNILFTIPFCFSMSAYSSSALFIKPLFNNTVEFPSYRDWSWPRRLLVMALGIIMLTSLTLIYTQDVAFPQTIVFHIVLCISLLGGMIGNFFNVIQFRRMVMNLRENILSD